MTKSAFRTLNSPPLTKRKMPFFLGTAGYTQRQLAARLKREPSFVARVEMGERRVDLLEFYFICRAYGVSPHQVAANIMKRFAREDRKRAKPGKAKR